jgi:polyisoprenoid-binding protein YceI
MRRRRILLVAVGATVAVAGYGALVLVSGDAPERAELGAAPADDDGAHRLEGVWVVADGPASYVGYRVRERLGPVAAPSDAVGRTGAVEGSARIEAGELTELEVVVEMAGLDSGSSARDDFVRDEALDVEQFPTAALRLDAAVPLGDVARGAVVDLSVPAELTLRDETHRVDLAVQARWNGSTIQAAGSTTIRRSDYGIDVSSRAGFNIDEQGTIEFELTFSAEGAPVDAPPSTITDPGVVPTEEGERRPPCSGAPDLTLDRPLLVATDDETGRARIETVAGAGAPTPIHEDAGLTGGVSWAQDGERVVFSSLAADEAPRTLSTAAADGSGLMPVPGLSDVTHPDWGPAGLIAFVRWTGEDSDIWVVAPDGSAARRLVATPGIDADPRWSPDGRSILFTTATERDNQDIVTVDADGGDLRTVAGGSGYEYAPSFGPDGDVLFVRDGSVMAVDPDGAERQLTDGPSDTNPELSPDGRHLALLREGSLFVSTDGADPVCVATGRALTGGPRWRP